MVEHSSVVERWNLVDTADLAVRLKSVLRRRIDGRPLPKDSDGDIGAGIDFLRQATGGGAIILGHLPETSSFEGTLSPLRWAADVRWASVRSEPRSKKEYTELVDTLKEFEQSLLAVREAIASNDKNAPESGEIEPVAIFFDCLGKILLQEADPVVREYSHSAE